MHLLGVLCCFCFVVQYRAAEIETSSQSRGVISSEHGFKPEQRSEDGGYVRNEVVHPGPMVQLLVQAARGGSQQSTGRTGTSEMTGLMEEPVVGNNQTEDGDPRTKRSPHRHRKGCFSCGYGGGGFGFYVEPIRIQPVYVKTIEYVQPVYQKPVYSYQQPHYSSGCSTCGQWGGGGGGGSGSFSHSQSSASSSSYSYGYGRK